MQDKREAVYADEMKWEKVQDLVYEKILWKDEKSGTYARLIRVDAGFRGEKALSHEFDEVVYILQGQVKNTQNGKIWHQGMFCFFPNGVEHGPLETEEGCLSIEFRYLPNR